MKKPRRRNRHKEGDDRTTCQGGLDDVSFETVTCHQPLFRQFEEGAVPMCARGVGLQPQIGISPSISSLSAADAGSWEAKTDRRTPLCARPGT